MCCEYSTQCGVFINSLQAVRPDWQANVCTVFGEATDWDELITPIRNIYIKKTNYSLNIYPLNTFEFRGEKMTKEKKGLGWPCH